MIIGANVFQTMARLGSIEGVDHGLMGISEFTQATQTIFDLGYQQVELLTDPMLMAFNQNELVHVISKLNDLGKARPTRWSVHLPFWWVNGASLDENIREASVRTYQNIIDLTRPLKPSHYVLHSITNLGRVKKANTSQVVKDLTTDRIVASAKRTAQDVINILGDPKLLCIENMTNIDFGLDLVLAKELGASLCLDVGHHFQRGNDALEFLAEHFDQVRCIHAHNVIPTIAESDAVNWRVIDHFALGEGLIDNEKLLKWLIQHNYQGSLIVEVRSSNEGQKSIDYLRSLKIIN